jgi:hypothetical protein
MSSRIKHEIEAALRADGPGTRGANASFHELVRDDDPAGMQVAEDLLLERGWKMREVTGGMRARNFTIEMNPMHRPGSEWKMVQTNVIDKGSTSEYGARTQPGQVLIRLSVANGTVRVSREREFKSDVDQARRIAVANAWAIAKAIKPLPLDASRAAIERIVDANFTKKTQNLRPRELF